ncbi:MAG TPA: SHOCT domain-containing protein [bacterium]|nr:SHOCT domain-containing protein [bacterium]
MGPWMMGGWGWGAAGLSGILTLFFWLLIIGGILLLIIWGFRQAGPVELASHRPLDIVKERYARGELTHEQYEQMRRDLE